MTERALVQKLAAILMADVVGYSRLMGADEVGTLAALTRHRREFIDPTIAAFDGRLVKTTGDGFLLEFPSAVDAVRCAVSLQQGLAARNASMPAEKRVVFRMGINIGDIILQDGDIFGNGVNVAARIEPLAEPGGLAISESTYDQVRDRLGYPFEDRGDVQVKNIARSISVRVLSAEALVALPEEVGRPSVPRVWRSRRATVLAGGAALLIACGLVIGGLMTLSQEPPQARTLGEQLIAVLSKALPNVPPDEIAKLVKDYQEGGAHRSIAVAVGSGEHRWTADWPTTDVADEKALERCQMTYGEPCAVVGYDDSVVLPDASGKWIARDVGRVRYTGAFSIDKIPAMRPSVLQRPEVVNYAAAAGPKAIAIHPQGIFSVVTGAESQHSAEEQALKKCNEDPGRKRQPTRCLLYASGNQVVLPLRKAKPQAQ